MTAPDPPPSASASPGAGADGGDQSDFWEQVALAAATAAGSVAWVSLVGSGIMALRLRNAGLPVEPVVALMSPEHRFAVGAGILAGPLFAGAFAAFVDWAVTRKKKMTDRQRQHLLVLTIVLAAPLGYWLLRPDLLTFLAELVAVASAVAIALAVHHQKRASLRERIVIFAAVLVSAGLIAVGAERIGQTKLSTATLTVTRATPVKGGYLTSTDYAVLVVPTVARCPMIKAVPRDQIVRIEITDQDADTPDPNTPHC
jgi:hypothetical protein